MHDYSCAQEVRGSKPGTDNIILDSAFHPFWVNKTRSSHSVVGVVTKDCTVEVRGCENTEIFV